jgi:hypothetical protein
VLLVTADFVLSFTAICAAQAAASLVPGRPPRLPAALRRPGLALIPTAVIAGIVAVLVLVPSAATELATLAGVGVPLLALVSPIAAPARVRPWLLALAVAALPFAFLLDESSRGAEIARAVLIVLSAAPLAWLAAAAAPPLAVELGIVVTAMVDTVLVVGQQIGPASNTLHDAAPAAGLPPFQDVTFGPVLMGYGDVFLAALLGAVLAARASPRVVPALVLWVLATAFGIGLLQVVDIEPATVPVAVTLLLVMAWRARRQAPLPPSTGVAGAAGTTEARTSSRL